MRGIGPWLCVLVVLFATTAGAAELDVIVLDARGKPVDNAVLTVRQAPTPGIRGPAPPRAPLTRIIDQSNLAFVPYLADFRPGDRVVFRNSDRTRHHVYSFSPTKAFDFILSPGDSSAPLILDKAGIVAVGCNIHDRMIAYLFVSNADIVTQVGKTGRARVPGLAPGSYTVAVWQPRQRPLRSDPPRVVVIGGSAPTAPVVFRLSLLPDSRRQPDHQHSGY